MKNPCDTKSRLSTVFSVAQRVELSLNMLDRVVTASKSSIANDTVIVGSDSVKFWSNEHDVDWTGASNNDLNEDLHLAMCQSAQDEFVPIYIPGDVPFAKSSDINEVIKSSNDGSGVVLVPSGQDGGTNCFLNPFPLFFKPLLGINSFERHIQFVENQNVPFSVKRCSSLLLDLDTESDLSRCDSIEPGFRDRLGKPV